MKISIKYYKELSLLTGILVAAILLILYWIDSSGVAHTGGDAAFSNSINTPSFAYHITRFWELMANL